MTFGVNFLVFNIFNNSDNGLKLSLVRQKNSEFAFAVSCHLNSSNLETFYESHQNQKIYYHEDPNSIAPLSGSFVRNVCFSTSLPQKKSYNEEEECESEKVINDMDYPLDHFKNDDIQIEQINDDSTECNDDQTDNEEMCYASVIIPLDSNSPYKVPSCAENWSLIWIFGVLTCIECTGRFPFSIEAIENYTPGISRGIFDSDVLELDDTMNVILNTIFFQDDVECKIDLFKYNQKVEYIQINEYIKFLESRKRISDDTFL